MAILVPDYVDMYLDFLSGDGREQSTIVRYRSDILKFLSWLDSNKKSTSLEQVRSLSNDDLRGFIKSMEQDNLSAATIKRVCAVVSKMMAHYKANNISALHTATKTRPLRDLDLNDFISDKEFKDLIESVLRPRNNDQSLARDFLINRNAAIILLIRHYGLTPSEITQITMNDINMAQLLLRIDSRKLQIDEKHRKYIIEYLNTFENTRRPRYRSADPLFVSFNNLAHTYHFDFSISKPRQMTVRAIQKMIKNEVEMAGLRKISSTNLRNAAILDKLEEENEDNVMNYFGMKGIFSLHRYKKYISNHI